MGMEIRQKKIVKHLEKIQITDKMLQKKIIY